MEIASIKTFLIPLIKNNTMYSAIMILLIIGKTFHFRIRATDLSKRLDLLYRRDGKETADGVKGSIWKSNSIICVVNAEVI